MAVVNLAGFQNHIGLHSSFWWSLFFFFFAMQKCSLQKMWHKGPRCTLIVSCGSSGEKWICHRDECAATKLKVNAFLRKHSPDFNSFFELLAICLLLTAWDLIWFCNTGQTGEIYEKYGKGGKKKTASWDQLIQEPWLCVALHCEWCEQQTDSDINPLFVTYRTKK